MWMDGKSSWMPSATERKGAVLGSKEKQRWPSELKQATLPPPGALRMLKSSSFRTPSLLLYPLVPLPPPPPFPLPPPRPHGDLAITSPPALASTEAWDEIIPNLTSKPFAPVQMNVCQGHLEEGRDTPTRARLVSFDGRTYAHSYLASPGLGA